MAPRGEILDSDDDDDDFGSVNGDFGDAPEATESRLDPILHHDKHNDDDNGGGKSNDYTPAAGETTIVTGHSTGSTDPSFFQQIYQEQQAAAGIHQDIPGAAACPSPPPPPPPPPPDAASPSLGTITSTRRRTQMRQSQQAKSSLTSSVTDPVPRASRKKTTTTTRKQSSTMVNEVVDLIQITTPRKGGAGHQDADNDDPWALPPDSSLPSLGSVARVASSSEKRRRGAGEQQMIPVSNDLRGEGKVVGGHMSPSREVADPYDFPEEEDGSPVRPAKRTKRGTQTQRQSRGSDISQQTADADDVSGAGGARSRRSHDVGSNGRLDSSIPPTMPTMIIAPTSLPTSQKQQYMTVSLLSQSGHQDPEQHPLPPPASIQANGTYKSSGATTVAYPTPSRFASSDKMGITDSMLPYPVNRVPASPGEQDQMSSPDELAGSARSRRTRASAVPVAELSSELESPVMRRSARRGSKHATQSGSQGHYDDPIGLNFTQMAGGVLCEEAPEAADEDGDLQEYGDHEEVEISGEMEDGDFEQDMVGPPVIQEAPPKKKRGRKKKEQAVQEAVAEEAPDDLLRPAEEVQAPAVEFPAADAEEPPAKRRRGRPRKSDTAAKSNETVAKATTQMVLDEEEAALELKVPVAEEEPAVETKEKKPNKRGRKKKQPVDEESDEQKQLPSAKEPEHHRALSEIPRNSRQSESEVHGGDAKGEDTESITPTAKNAATAKKEGSGTSKATVTTPGSSSTTPGKVQYRVGLSRKTRIAPLLKSLRK